MWPDDDTASLTRYYGAHVLGRDGRPTAGWQSMYLTLIPVPYPLRLSWDTTVRVSRIRCHRRVAASLARIFAAIRAAYTDVELEAHGLDLYGGCYEFRRIRGASRPSTHAWGAGIDLDPDGNPMGRVPADCAMPVEVVTIFAHEGWRWGGTFTRPDAMHFQATQ